jgi:hypothetical protein
LGTPAASAQQVDPCQVYGQVYLVDKPEQADFTVYIEKNSSPDILLYVPVNRLYADRPGTWYFVKKAAFADFRIHITEDRNYADFTIEYTDVEDFAGCQ